MLSIACLAASPAGASDKGVKMRGDKKYGECWGSAILADFFKRNAPPRNARFNLELDIDKQSNEIYVYYRDVAEYDGLTAFYSGETCEFLRTEQKDKASAKNV